MLMPSSKGWVKFSPYFLSREELLKSWVKSLPEVLPSRLLILLQDKQAHFTHFNFASGVTL